MEDEEWMDGYMDGWTIDEWVNVWNKKVRGLMSSYGVYGRKMNEIVDRQMSG